MTNEEQVLKVLNLLKLHSLYTIHNNNMAREYIFLEDSKDYLTLGINCVKSTENSCYYRLTKEDAEKNVWKRIVEKYTLIYGVSLVNMVYLLEKKDHKIITISRIIDKKDFYYNKFVITIEKKEVHEYNEFQSFDFWETNNLAQFSYTKLFVFLYEEYKDEIEKQSTQ